MMLPLRPQSKPACLPSNSVAGRSALPFRSAPIAAAAGDAPPPQPPIGGGGGGISEDVLARLRAAEEEAAALRAQLASVQQTAVEAAEGAATTPAAAAGTRIDGAGLYRETPFAPPSAEASWLSESQVDFFAGAGGLGETAGGRAGAAPSTPEVDAIVRRRLLVGGAASVALAAFALVPTDALRLGRPAAPLFTYLTPLVRAGPLLAAAKAQAAEGEWGALAATLASIQGPPTEVEANLRSAAAHADVPPAARTAAAELARDALDAVSAIDYDSYFDSVGPVGGRGGAREKQFADFSSAAAAAAAAKVEAFLALMPGEALQAARDRVAAQAAGGY